MIKLIGQILAVMGSGLTGMYFVSTMAMENVVLNFEQREDKKTEARERKQQIRNDVLVNKLSRILQQSQNAFSLDEYGEMAKEIVNDSERSIKRFIKSENNKQEEQFEIFYFLDQKDSTFKMISYKGADGNYTIIRMIPISEDEFNRINN